MTIIRLPSARSALARSAVARSARARSARAVWLALLGLAFLWGCATARLADDERLYVGGSVRVDAEDEPIRDRRALERSLEGELLPRPNTTILGLRPPLWVYSVTGASDADGVARWFQDRFGEPPVLFDDSIPEQTVPALEDWLVNRGFFDSEVDFDVRQTQTTASVVYRVLARPAWTVSGIAFPDGDDPLVAAIRESAVESLVQPDVPYDLATLRSERERIDVWVRERGFFAFSPTYVVFDAELDAEQLSVALTVAVEAPSAARARYRIESIAIYADYASDRPLPDRPVSRPADGVEYFEEFSRFNPVHIVNAIVFAPGDVYDRRAHTRTIARLNAMGAFRFVNVRYRSDAERETLRAEVLLTPLAPRTVQGEISAVQRLDGFAGPAARVEWIDRNLARGGERLDVGVGTGLETRITAGSFAFEALEFDFTSALEIPRSVGPLSAIGLVDRYGTRDRLPTTTIRAGARRQLRFGRGVRDEAYLTLAYAWPGRVSQVFEPMAVTAVRRRAHGDPDPDDELLVEAAWRARTATTSRPATLSGGLTVGAELVAGAPFAVIDTDVRGTLDLFEGSLLAYRLRTGAGRTVGRDASLPDTRLFTVGGSTGLRGFTPGSFGPGARPPVESGDAAGELRIEGSVEYRYAIVGWFYGALFADVGNTWMLSGSDRLPSVPAAVERIPAELAVSVGTGVRVDPGVIVLRLDVGIPVRKPWRAPADRWVIDEWDFTDPDWRRENVIVHLSVGYPF
ncbi:MAG: hypothetical protein EA382_13950 [Spirochaetaceae bacterium]|nr:MAG: hypothetical protein EA382_13950 [Spirochaetaceae bacterium]